MREATVRPATKEDWPAILRCQDEINERMGKKMDLPDLDDPAILEFVVAEFDGEVIGFHYQEKCIEMCHGGLNPLATLAFQKHKDSVFEMARSAGIRYVHCQVPKEFPDVGKHLEDSGFNDNSEKYSHFVLDLRE